MLKKKNTIIRNDFNLYKQIRSALRIPLRIEIYFDLLEYSLTQNQKQIKIKQGFNIEFIKGFITLSKTQKQKFILANIGYLYNFYYQGSTSDQVQQQQQHMLKYKEIIQILPKYDKYQNYQGKCQVLTDILGIPYWQYTQIYLQTKRKSISLNNNSKSILDLRMYLVRKSKKNENTLVLESVSNKTNKNLIKVSLFFKQQIIFSKVFESIFNIIVSHRNYQLIKQLKSCEYNDLSCYNNNKLVNDYRQISGIQLSVRPLIFLNQQNINEFLIHKKTINNYLFSLHESFYPIYQRNDYTVFKSSSDSSFYKLQNTFNLPKSQIRNKFFNNFQQYQYINKTEIFQTFSNKYQAVYQQYNIKGKKIEQIVIKKQNQQENTENPEILLIKHVDSIINKSFMEFCSFNLYKYGDSACKLIIFGCFNPILINGPMNLILLLEGYVNMITGDQPLQIKDLMNHKTADISKQEYYSIIEESSLDMFNQLEQINLNNNGDYFNNNSDEQLPTPLIQNQKNQVYKKKVTNRTVEETVTLVNLNVKNQLKTTDQKINKESKYLFYKYQVLALPKDSVKSKIQSTNWLQMQWKRIKGGGLVCKNEKIIEQQRKIYKKLLVSFGEQIIKTKGILNISLPVIMFKKESQLTSMAKTFKIVPYYMEKAVQQKDSLERFKYALATMVAINSLNLSFEKPFNPILGETLQIYVNGCPLYIQQISHHPPITSYYFVGRGYRLYGAAAIKIDIGLNYAKGYSELAHTIQFDDGKKIEYLFPKLCIGGLLLGDRTFNFEGKTYMYDLDNGYFADILFGQVKKTFFASDEYPLDAVSGKVYTMKEGFRKFYELNRPKIQIEKTWISQQICEISGIWNQSLKIQKKLYTNFIGADSDPVFELEENEFVLPSDSRYRADLKFLIKGQLDKAQDAKVEMEENQRKDRKFRADYQNKTQ